jgi:fatty-acyl-CoA synthase
VTQRLAEAARAARTLARSGALTPSRPDQLVRAGVAFRHWGTSLAAAFAVAGARYGDRIAIIDDRGTLTFAEVDARTDALARGLAAAGVANSQTVAVLCRNSRYIVEIGGALAKCGAHAVYLNTGFAAPQIDEVYTREGATALVYDDEFATVVQATNIERRLGAPSDIESLIAGQDVTARLDRPGVSTNTVILTSGTTGTPKGARRDLAAGGLAAVTLLDRIPYRARETMVVAAPIFHSWGATNALTGLMLGDTIVLTREFDAEHTLSLVAQHRAQALAAVPVMLLRIMELAHSVRAGYDTSSLRLVACSGSAFAGDLPIRFMDEYGNILYNLYGSTEVGVVSIASPTDMRAAPATAGRPPRGTDVRLLDEADLPVARGDVGRIFVRGPFLFEGYTDGNSKQMLDGFMRTGDTGHFDGNGLLFVDGRDDDMIVSGGENVYPGEVEHAIATHPDVVDAAVISVPDAEFGQRLKAYVVARPGASVDADAIRTHVRSSLARYKVPRDVEFVAELPRNPTGKVVKRELH